MISYFFTFNQHYHLQAKIEEDHLRIAVLFYLSFCQIQLVHDGLHITVMNEGRKADGKIALGFHLVIEFGLPNVTDIVLAHLLLGILEEMFLFLASDTRHLQTPLLETFERVPPYKHPGKVR